MSKPRFTTFIPTMISRIQDYGQRIREIELKLPDGWIVTSEFVLPQECEYLYGNCLPVLQKHRPGNSFLAWPFGNASKKNENRLYTVSDCSYADRLATVIDRTKNNPNTSDWWLSEKVSTKTAVFCKARLDLENKCFVMHEHRTKGDMSVELYPNGEWEKLRVVAVGLSTGMTPFLAHVKYFEGRAFGQNDETCGIEYTFIMSVQHPEELVWYNWLRAIAKTHWANFIFHPILTQSWPEHWPEEQRRRITVPRLLELVPDLSEHELWYCGGTAGKEGLERGLAEVHVSVKKFRAETFD